MVVRFPVRAQSRYSSLLLLAGLPLLTGCSRLSLPSATSASATPAPHLRTVSAPVSITPQQNALAAVQSLPLYQQAQQACQAKQYRRASDLLAQLAASASLSPEQAAFVHEQRNLCLHGAGLPLVKGTGNRAQATAEPVTSYQSPTRIVGLAPCCWRVSGWA